ncbi:MAG: Fe-S cluster assembly protein SufD [Myxococcota bacterium]|jgi:Fe-S cluster assembly protein SufD
MSDWRATFVANQDTFVGGAHALAWRESALAAFEDAGMPRPKSRGWKHTPLRALKSTFNAAPVAYNGAIPRIEGAVNIVLVGGVVDESQSDALPEGVTVTSLQASLSMGAPALPADAPATLNAPFDTLNIAFVNGGTVVTVAKNSVIEAPIVLVHVGGATGHAVHVQNHIRVERGAKATIVELWVMDGLANALTTTDTGANAELHHVVLQNNGPEALFLADHRHVLARDARIFGTSVALGSSLARIGVHTRLNGEGAECSLSGVYLGQGTQHHDHTLRMEHKAPNCTSNQKFRGILGGKSRGVFSSLLVVTETGVKADGTQDNRNVLLSKTARANSEPMLEIYTDDVKAAHGSAIGKLDDAALFYMRARGINASTARRMLTGGIAREIIAEIANDPIRIHAETLVEAWLLESVE